MTWREITVDELTRLKRVTLIDVRSPGEFLAESIPGAINVPLLSDQERVIIGTIYATEGESVARVKALKMVSPKIPELLDQIIAQRSKGALVVHCWRGGLRSEAVASCLSIVGIDSFRLKGGYKAWRQMVVGELTADNYAFDLIKLHGLTGTGKTEVLHELKTLGLPTIDLEGLARHRGSAFGATADSQPSQKDFEAALWQNLREFSGGEVFIEAESRKIGAISLPNFLFERLKKCPTIMVTGSTSKRVSRILQSYGTDKAAIARALTSLDHLKAQIGTERIMQIKAMADEGQFAPIVESLLLDYYDPLYQKGINQCAPFVMTVDGDDARVAAQAICATRCRPSLE